MLPTQNELILATTHFFKGGVPKPPPPPKPPAPQDAAASVDKLSNRRRRYGFQETILTQGLVPTDTTAKKTLLGM